jgi:hypothetical protein
MWLGTRGQSTAKRYGRRAISPLSTGRKRSGSPVESCVRSDNYSVYSDLRSGTCIALGVLCHAEAKKLGWHELAGVSLLEIALTGQNQSVSVVRSSNHSRVG